MIYLIQANFHLNQLTKQNCSFEWIHSHLDFPLAGWTFNDSGY